MMPAFGASSSYAIAGYGYSLNIHISASPAGRTCESERRAGRLAPAKAAPFTVCCTAS
ncbi:hypothetical protein CHELA1G2_20255 [Hyphomicrobiales bacterium]|nr:hypothetical protein CHELA1G2_20255 [Hyphomicrobiales bacterium]